MHAKILTFTCFIALTLPSLSFAAAGSSGIRTIKQVQVNQFGRVLIWGNTYWDNPASACGSSEYLVLRPNANEYYSEIYALIAATYLQGKEVSGWLDGCYDVNGTTYPILRNITGY